LTLVAAGFGFARPKTAFERSQLGYSDGFAPSGSVQMKQAARSMKGPVAGAVTVLVAVLGGVGVARGWWPGPWSASPGNPGVASAAGAASAPKPAQSVTVVRVQRRDLPLVVEAVGTLVSLNSVEIRPQLAATVRRVALREGQTVRQGDSLFVLDDRAEQAALDKARATLLRDQASLADLQRQWQRAQDLRAQNFIAQSAADTVLSQLEAQRALVSADEAALKSAQVSASFGSIRSPLAGRAGAINVFEGSLVQPSGAALVTISQMNPMGVSFVLPEARLAGVAAATQAGRLALTVQPGGSGGKAQPPVSGHVSFIDNAVDASTGTIRVKGELPNADNALWPGQYVTVKVTVAMLKDALVVPQAALIQRGQERQVYIVDASGQAQLKPVTLRSTQGEWAAVEGLAEGDTVVQEGKQNLRPGTPVKVAAEAGKAASAPASGASR
jgi:RND family efflux transporter MFP subunit